MLESGMFVYATLAGAAYDLRDEFRGRLLEFPPPLSSGKVTDECQIPGKDYFERYSWGTIAARYLEQLRFRERQDEKGARFV